MKNNFQKGYVVPVVIAIVVLVLGGSYVYYKTQNNQNKEVIHSELVSRYPALKDDMYLQSDSRFPDTEIGNKVCESQIIINYINKSSKAGYVGGNWRRTDVIDCGSTYYVNDSRDSSPRLYGPFDSTSSNPTNNLIKSCANGATNPPHCNADLPMPLPVITSITPSSGPIGTTIELKGTNLAGFEGDLDATIENDKGETAFLPGIDSVPRADQTIRVKIDSHLCKSNTGYSGMPCSSFMTITQGIYKIYTSPWSRMSNKVQFTVTSLNSISNWNTYVNSGNSFSFNYPTGWTVNSQFTTASSINFQNTGDISFALGIGKNTDVRGKQVTLEESLKDYGYDVNYDRESMVINGYSWLQFISKTRQNNASIRFMTVKAEIRYEFVMNIDRTMTNEDLILMKQILSTFKFTN